MSGAAAVAAVVAFAIVAVGAITARAGSWGVSRHREHLERLSREEFAELFVFIEPARFLKWNLLAVLVVPAVAWLATGAGVWALAGLALVVASPTVVHRRLRRRRMQALQRQLPDAIAAVAAGLRGGLALWQSMDLVPRHQPSPIAQEFALVLRQHRMGVSIDVALDEFARRTSLHDARMLAATLSIARDLGGGLAEALERQGASVRRRVAMEERIDSLTAQGRMQGVIVGALPFGVAAALFVLEPDAMSRMLTTPLGWLVVIGVLLLETCGALLIRRIVRIDV